MALRVASLFSGAMGLDIGLERAGMRTAVAVELDADAVATIRKNRPEMAVVDRSVEFVTGEEIRRLAGGHVDVLAGGPPCQAFSVFGRRKGLEDPRGRLVFEFSRLLNELKPSAFIMENVRGLLSMKASAKSNGALGEKGSLARLLFEEFAGHGYSVQVFVVNSANYGAPQVRERVIVLGVREEYDDASMPLPMYSNRPGDGLPPFRTLGDVIGPDSGFHEAVPEVMDFSDRKKKYLQQVPPGGNWRFLPVDVQRESMGRSWHLKGGRSAYWRRLSFDFPSPTVVTMPNHAGTSMCHPTETRAISVAEAAAIQEFPRDWVFVGSTASKFKQIGNAVPVRLGEVAGGALMRSLSGERGEPNPNVGKVVISHLRPHVRVRSFWKEGQSVPTDASYYRSEPAAS